MILNGTALLGRERLEESQRKNICGLCRRNKVVKRKIVRR